jgi:dTDP-4-amino-4,6-dideoxygalactose transaminase
MSKLAIDGGKPVRTQPLTGGKKWGWEELREVVDVFESGCYFRFGGSKVEQFERDFAETYGVRYAVASTSGTSAIHIAVGMIDPEPGDEIITAPITDLGSIVPILHQGAIPVFADSDPQTFCLDPADLERQITDRTRALMVVHLFGNPCDMDAIMDVARRHHLPVIEDCSQAHWTEYKGRICGTLGDIGCFSLQASKHITTGDGGMTITHDKAWGERGRLFMDKGWTRQPGWGPRTYLFLAPNYRMNEITGAIGCAQVHKLKDVVARRNALGDRLTELIGEAPGIRPQQVTPGGKHTYWLYALAVAPGGPYTAEEFARALSAEGIPAGPHYIGKPIFLCAEALCNKVTFGQSQWPFTHPGAREIAYTEDTCPRTSDLLQRMVTLPLHEFLTDRDVEDMAAGVRKVAEGLAAKAAEE